MLSQEDFQKLTKGKVVNKDGVLIALSDIGYDHMMQTIYNNMKDN